METNRSWSIDDRRLNFQFGCEVGWEVKNGKLGRLLRNPTYTGIGPRFWRSMDMLGRRRRRLGHAQLRQGPARPDRPHGPPGRARPGSATCGWGCGHEPDRRADLADRARRACDRAACPARRSRSQVDRHRLALTRFANSVIHQNVAEDATIGAARACTSTGARRPGRTTVATEDDVRGSSSGSPRRPASRPLDPTWPGLGTRARRPTGPPASTWPTAGATPAERAERRARRSSTPPAAWRPPGYCRTNHWTGAFANSAGQSVAGEATECGVSGIAREPARRRRRRPARARSRLADLDGAALGARAAAKARAWREPVELPPGRYEVVLEPTAVADILGNLAAHGFNGKAVNERTLVRRAWARPSSTRRCRSSTTRWPSGSPYDTEGTPPPAAPSSRPGSDGRGHPRPAHRGRGRGAVAPGTAATARSRSGRSPGTSRCCRVGARRGAAAEVDGPVRDSSRRRAGRPVSSAASWSPTSGTPACSTRARWP